MRLQNIIILLAILLAAGGIYYFSNVPEPPETVKPQTFVWSIDMEDIKHIEIRLPREDMSQKFIKISEEDKFPWYFDDEERSDVDVQRSQIYTHVDRTRLREVIRKHHPRP